LRIAILSGFVNNGRQTEPQATHGAAQFDKKQRYVERRLETEPNTDMQLFYRR
jgi:hypothetical protein